MYTVEHFIEKQATDGDIADVLSKSLHNPRTLYTSLAALAGSGLLGAYTESQAKGPANETPGERRMRILRNAALFGLGGGTAGLAANLGVDMLGTIPDKTPASVKDPTAAGTWERTKALYPWTTGGAGLAGAHFLGKPQDVEGAVKQMEAGAQAKINQLTAAHNTAALNAAEKAHTAAIEAEVTKRLGVLPANDAYKQVVRDQVNQDLGAFDPKTVEQAVAHKLQPGELGDMLSRGKGHTAGNYNDIVAEAMKHNDPSLIKKVHYNQGGNGAFDVHPDYRLPEGGFFNKAQQAILHKPQARGALKGMGYGMGMATLGEIIANKLLGPDKD